MQNNKKYKASLYNIIVKLPEQPDQFILVHGYTGAIDLVNMEVVKLLRNAKFVSPTSVGYWNVSEATIQNLIKRGYLTDLSLIEERNHVCKMAEMMHNFYKRKSGFLFIVAYDCNFRCAYCYENNISSSGRAWSKKVFTRETVDRAYATMLEINPDFDNHSKNILLYGGEPLLAKNYDIVKYIVEEGIKRGYYFAAVTNGFDLHHYSDLLRKEKIKWLQITLDGSPNNHNSRRIHYKFGKSFDRIINNISLALNKKVKIKLRINTDYNNFNDLEDLLELFKQRKWINNKYFSVYSAMVRNYYEEGNSIKCRVIMGGGSDGVEKQSLLYNDLEVENANNDQFIDFELKERNFESESAEVEEEVSEIKFLDRKDYLTKYYQAVSANPDLRMISCQKSNIESELLRAMRGEGLAKFRSVYCSAQYGMYIFDPFGDLYTCWETVGMSQHKVGSYAPNLEIEKASLDKWLGRNISNIATCSKCKYALFCGGGCEARAIFKGGRFEDSWCDSFPYVFHTLVPKAYKKYCSEIDMVGENN